MEFPFARTTWKIMMFLKSFNMSYNRIQVLHTLQPALVLPDWLKAQCSLYHCITQYMDMLFLRTAFETIIQSSTVTKWVRKETLLVNLWDSSKRTEHINLLIMFSIASRAGVGVGVGEYSVFSRWKLSCHLWFLQQWKSWGEKSNCTKGVNNSQKKGEAPFPSTLVLHVNQTWAVE